MKLLIYFYGGGINEKVSIIVDDIIFLPLWNGKCRFLYVGR
jgi:hypothetical protein